MEEEGVEGSPLKPPNLTRLFDSAEVDLRSDLDDWKSVKRELLETGGRQSTFL